MDEWRKLLKDAEQPGVVNLTQGYPDFEGSRDARKAAAEAMLSEETSRLNQYSPLVGLGSLMQSISDMYKRLWDWELSAEKNILVTTSGTEAISVAFQTLISPGDEVILFEPFFPWYAPVAKLAGGEAKLVRLRMEEGFSISKERLLAQFDRKKTKMIVLNTPHNPTGRVLSQSEVEIVHEVASMSEAGCVVFSDEAYEGQCWASGGHKKIAQEMAKLDRERGASVDVLTMGTASKLCSLTGWRVGWLLGSEQIISGCKAIHGYGTYCAPTVLQHGIGKALDGFSDFSFDGTSDLMKTNAKNFAQVLRDKGFEVYMPLGGYFVVVDCSAFFPSSMAFCSALLAECKVAMAPMNMFYGTPSEALAPNERCFVRIAICKTEGLIEEAISRIKTFDPEKKR